MERKLKDGMYCLPCNKLMKFTVLPEYEYEEGILLRNVEALKCPKCGEIIFTEEQAHMMRDRTKEGLLEFDRKIPINNKNLFIRKT